MTQALREEELAQYALNDSKALDDPNPMKNYSLYTPKFEGEEKQKQFEKIKKTRFKKMTMKNKANPTKQRRQSKQSIQYQEQFGANGSNHFGNNYETNKDNLNEYYMSSPKSKERILFQSNRQDSKYEDIPFKETSYQRVKFNSSNSKDFTKNLKSKDLNELNMNEMKLIFSLLDTKKLGFINKDNFNFGVLPSNLIKEMKSLITKVISSTKEIDFEEFLHLVYN